MSGSNVSYALVKVLIVSTFFLLSSIVGITAASADEPKVPFVHAKGEKLFQTNCAICHGKTLNGTKQGPPLLHPFYKPSHHADFAFYRAALKGVQAHHWEFGDMPPIQGITREDMDAIVPFIRWYQKEKGLF